MMGEIVNPAEMAHDTIKEKVNEFIEKSIDNKIWERIFVSAGQFVANYEHDKTEETEKRRIAFSKENMKVLAKAMLKVDFFQFENELFKNVKDLLAQNCMQNYNRERCLKNFTDIVLADIRKCFPYIMQLSFIMETRDNTHALLNNQYSLIKSNDQQLELLGQIYERIQNQGINYQQNSNREDSFFNEYFQMANGNGWYLGSLLDEGLTENVSKQKECALSAIEQWREERTLYPGWYIAPYQVHIKLYRKTHQYEHWIRLDFLPLEKEMLLCYELVWRYETGMLLYSFYLQRNIRNIWDTYYRKIIQSCETDDERKKKNIEEWFYIGMVLLREYREDGDCLGWKTVFDILTKFSKIVFTGKEELSIEELKYTLSRYQMNKVRRLCGRCSLPRDAYPYRFQFIGTKIECGDTEEALLQIRELKTDLILSLNEVDNKGHKLNLESLYVALLHLESLIQQGVAFKKGEYEKKQEKINQVLAQIEEGRCYFDWKGTCTYVERELLKWHAKKYNDQQLFDLSRDKVVIFGAQSICEESYYLYRVMDAMAMPLISDSVNYIGYLEGVWFEALQEITPFLALQLMLRGSGIEGIKVCYNRRQMALLDQGTINMQLQYLLEVFEENLEEMSELDYVGGGVVQRLQINISEILMRCVSRCPEELQREVLLLIKDIMETPNLRLNDRIDLFIHGVMQQISEKNKMRMLGELIQTKIIEHPIIGGYATATDLFDYYFQKDNLNQYKELCIIKHGTIEWLLSDSNDSPYVWTTKVRRLIILQDIGMLDKEQKYKLTEKIWSRVDEQTGLPKLPNWYVSNYMNLEYRNANIPVVSIKKYLAGNGMMALFAEENGCRITMGEIRYINEIIALLRTENVDFWSAEDVEDIYWDALNYWTILKDKIENTHRELGFSEYRTRANRMLYMLAELYKSAQVTLSEKCQKAIRVMLDEMERYNIDACILSILFIPSHLKKSFVEKLIDNFYSEKMQTSVDSFNAAYILIEREPHTEFAHNLFNEIIGLLRNRKMPGLESAIVVLHNLLYSDCEIFTSESIRMVDKLLITLEKATIYKNNASSEKSVKVAARIRRACAGLAYQISLHSNREILPGVRHWQEICKGNEFNDVRNEMLS